MSPNSSPDLLSVFSEMTGRTPAEIRSSTRAQRQTLVDNVMRDRGWPDRYRQFNISNRNQLASRVEAAAQRSWFRDYIYDTDRGVISNAASIVTMRPVEGVVNAIPLVNRIPYIGKIARIAAIGAAAYFGGHWLWNLLRQGNLNVADAAHRTIRGVANATNAATPTSGLTGSGSVLGSGSATIPPDITMGGSPLP